MHAKNKDLFVKIAIRKNTYKIKEQNNNNLLVSAASFVIASRSPCSASFVYATMAAPVHLPVAADNTQPLEIVQYLKKHSVERYTCVVECPQKRMCCCISAIYNIK